MDTVLPREFDLKQVNVSVCGIMAWVALTGIFKVVSDSDTSIRAALQLEELPKFVNSLRRNYLSRELGEIFADLQGREGRRWDIKIVALVLEELQRQARSASLSLSKRSETYSETERPEVVRGDSYNL